MSSSKGEERTTLVAPSQEEQGSESAGISVVFHSLAPDEQSTVEDTLDAAKGPLTGFSDKAKAAGLAVQAAWSDVVDYITKGKKTTVEEFGWMIEERKDGLPAKFHKLVGTLMNALATFIEVAGKKLGISQERLTAASYALKNEAEAHFQKAHIVYTKDEDSKKWTKNVERTNARTQSRSGDHSR